MEKDVSKASQPAKKKELSKTESSFSLTSFCTMIPPRPVGTFEMTEPNGATKSMRGGGSKNQSQGLGSKKNFWESLAIFNTCLNCINTSMNCARFFG